MGKNSQNLNTILLKIDIKQLIFSVSCNALNSRNVPYGFLWPQF